MTISIMTVYLSILVGITLLTFASHVIITFRADGIRLHGHFSIMCLAVMIYTFCTMLEYQTQDTSVYINLIRVQVLAISFFMTAAVLFTVSYTKTRLNLHGKIFILLVNLFMITRAVHPTTLTIADLKGMIPHILPWDEIIYLAWADMTQWLIVYYLFVLWFFVIVFSLLWKGYRFGQREESISMFIAMLILMCTVINDMVVPVFKLEWVYLMETGYVAIIMVMSNKLFNDVLRLPETENKLEDLRIQRQALFNTMDHFIGLLDTDGKLLDANQTSLAFVDKKLEDLKGHHFRDCPWWDNLPDEKEKLDDAVRRAAAGETVRFETVNRNASGGTRVMDFSLKPLLDENGKITRIIPEGQDITDLHTANQEITAVNEELQATIEELEATNEEFEAQNEELIRSEEELSQSEAFIRRIVENAPAVINRYSITHGRFEFVSPRVYRMAGYTPEEFYDNPGILQEFVHPDWFQRVFTWWRGFRDDSSPPVMEYQVRKKNGDTIWVREHSHLIRDEQGNPSAIEGIILDIEDKKKAEERLIREKSFISTVLDTLPGIFFMLDEEGGFIRWKRQQSNALGYTPEEIWTMDSLDFIAEEERESVAAMMSKVLEEGHAYGDATIVSKNGERFSYFLNGSCMSLEDTKYIVCVGIDITSRKAAEREKELTQAQLLQAQKMEAVGTLAGGLAHDFNNMLGGIMGSLNLVEILFQRDKLPDREKILNFIQTALESTRRASDLTRQLLTLSRKSELKLAPVDVNLTMKHVMKLCKNSFPKSIELDFSIGASPLRIKADPVQMEQVLLNLCVNASHAMTSMRLENQQGGTLSVSAGHVLMGKDISSLHPGVIPGNSYVKIQVKDTGVGMDENTRQQIFDPFFTTKSKEEGTGLGLAMAYSIVKQHGGFIDVYSKPGEGSSFTVYLPSIDESGSGLTDSITGNHRIARGSGKLLVVDDENAILQVTGGILEECGYSVIPAKGGKEALDIFTRDYASLDMVMLDLSMPGISGLEVFERMKVIDPKVIVILVSGFMEDDVLKDALSRGISGFLQKPYSAEELSIKVKELL